MAGHVPPRFRSRTDTRSGACLRGNERECESVCVRTLNSRCWQREDRMWTDRRIAVVTQLPLWLNERPVWAVVSVLSEPATLTPLQYHMHLHFTSLRHDMPL